MQIDKKIERFISHHNVLTLATATNDGAPYCCNCFYAYDADTAAFIFTTDSTTRHGQMMSENNRVQGLQITGTIKPAADGDKMTYIKSFPYAAVADLHLWRLEADFLKLTDNTLGFGKKLIWQREE